MNRTIRCNLCLKEFTANGEWQTKDKLTAHLQIEHINEWKANLAANHEIQIKINELHANMKRLYEWVH